MTNKAFVELVNGDHVIIEPDRINRSMAIDDIYKYRFVETPDRVFKSPDDPDQPRGKYLPKEGDMIWSWELGFYRVAAVDKTTYLADLVKWDQQIGSNVQQEGNILEGITPAGSSNIWRAYLDTSVIPHRLSFDDRYFVPGSESRYSLAFLGTNVTANGEIVSAHYDNTGTYVSERVPLEVVAMTQFENVSIKRPKMTYCRRALDTGETITLVSYNEHNAVIGKDTFIVQRTNAIRRPEQGNRRVSSIEIVSPYLSETQPNLLEVPINATISTISIRARVNYTDGTHRELDVGDEDSDSRFRILGLKYWSPAQVGPEQNITLAYKLDTTTEYSYIQGETFNSQIIAPYRIKSLPVDPSFSLKLFAFPTWRDAINGWTLDYWLYNLDRNISTRVQASAVELVSGSPSFNPTDYVTIQNLGFAVNLRAVDDQYGDHRHVQNLQVALLGDGSQNIARWKVRTTANQGDWFGESLYAAIRSDQSGLYDIDIKNNHVDYQEWLNEVYYKSNPLINPGSEVRAPEPTHMLITHNLRTMEVPISQWGTPLKMPTELKQGQNLYIRWIKRIANTDLHLGVSALTVRML